MLLKELHSPNTDECELLCFLLTAHLFLELRFHAKFLRIKLVEGKFSRRNNGYSETIKLDFTEAVRYLVAVTAVTNKNRTGFLTEKETTMTFSVKKYVYILLYSCGNRLSKCLAVISFFPGYF